MKFSKTTRSVGFVVLVSVSLPFGCDDAPSDLADVGDSSVADADAGDFGDNDVEADSEPTCDSGCSIDSKCYPDGVTNPENICEICDVALSSVQWSDDDGSTCDDGAFCTTVDSCLAGVCNGTTMDCSDGVACNGDESCNEDDDICEPGELQCADDEVCSVADDACVTVCTGCVVDGVCYGQGQTNPLNVCELCDTAISTTEWSDHDGSACDDGAFCTLNDRCDSGVCAGTPTDCSDGVACNGVESCSEDADTCLAGTATCASHEICFTLEDRCVGLCPGCLIGDTCYGDGQLHPSNVCLLCDIAMSQTVWSPNDYGTVCDDADFCNGDDFCDGGFCVGHRDLPCQDDGFFCNGEESCDSEAGRCAEPISPCSGDDVCFEDGDQCCVPDVPVTSPVCNDEDDVTWFDSCDREHLVEDCEEGGNHICEGAACGCASGFSGEDCDQCVVYVDAGQSDPSGADGSSWDLAFAHVQQGVDAAALSGCEVWVAGGTYGPLVMKDEVALYGGFTGSEISRSQRDSEAIDTVINGSGHTASASCSAVEGCGDSAVLDGFVLTNGSNSGLRIVNASPTIVRCRIESNRAPNGGGVYIEGGSPAFDQCQIVNNSAASGADGADSADGADGVLDGEDGHDADAAESGGDGGHGGGVYITSGDPTFSDCLFADNQSGDGGHGGYGGDGGDGLYYLELASSSSAGNDGGMGGTGGDGGHGGNGGGVYLSSGGFSCVDCRFLGNRAGRGGEGGSGGHGGHGHFNALDHSQLGAYGGRGGPGRSGGDGGDGGHAGALYVANGSADLSSCQFDDNAAGLGGNGGRAGNGGNGGPSASGGRGGIGANGGDGGDGGRGGAIVNDGAASIVNCVLTNNTTGVGGDGGPGGYGGDGGHFVEGPDFGEFGGSGGNGGDGGSGGPGGEGGGLDDDGSATVVNALFLDNQAASGGSGDVGGLGGYRGAHDSSIDGFDGAAGTNGVNGSGGGLAATLSATRAVNSIFRGNSTPGGASQIATSGSGESPITYSDVQGGFEGTGNIDVEPGFVDAAAGDYRLQRYSPCIDAGDDTAVLAIETDIAGEPRLTRDAVDMGPYEHQSTDALLLPSTCSALATVIPGLPDGPYPLYYDGDANLPWNAYCANMSSSPREYLSLLETGADQNYSQYTVGGAASGVDVRSRFTRVRIDPASLQVTIGDHTFATSEGIASQGANTTTSVSYGTATSCVDAYIAAGRANITLIGTPFRVVENAFSLVGYLPDGAATYSSNGQVVDLIGGGHCGSLVPSSGTLPLELLP